MPIARPRDRLEDRIRALGSELIGFLRRRTADPEEVAQETWMRVAAAEPTCDDERSFRAYVYVVARRLLIDHARRRARSPLVPLEGGVDMDGGARPDADLAAGEALVVVEEALARMKPELAEVFRLRMTTDLSFRQIAEQQGVSLNTALGRHHQATSHLARALAAHGQLPE